MLGTISVNEEVTIIRHDGSIVKTKVTAIEMFKKLLGEAEAGMEVQVVTPVNQTVQVNNWQYVEEAYMRMFGISLRKANCLNTGDLEITKLK